MLVNHARDSKPHCIVLSYRCARAYSSDSEKRTMPITCASPAADVAVALVIVLALAIVLALQSAIEPNFIPPEIKQRALPQTRPYDVVRSS